jgi:hypothetical protein
LVQQRDPVSSLTFPGGGGLFFFHCTACRIRSIHTLDDGCTALGARLLSGWRGISCTSLLPPGIAYTADRPFTPITSCGAAVTSCGCVHMAWTPLTHLPAESHYVLACWSPHLIWECHSSLHRRGGLEAGEGVGHRPATHSHTDRHTSHTVSLTHLLMFFCIKVASEKWCTFLRHEL